MLLLDGLVRWRRPRWGWGRRRHKACARAHRGLPVIREWPQVVHDYYCCIISKCLHWYKIKADRAALAVERAVLALPDTRSHLQHTTNVLEWLARVSVLQHSQSISEFVRQDLDQAGDILASLTARGAGEEERRRSSRMSEHYFVCI